MTSCATIGKLKKIGAMLMLFVICAVFTVRADQQYVLAVGETMVLPCLLEVWSDQSVSCVIGDPEVLMSDDSGRAVIALSEGISDVYIHMTNPDTDIQYTFVVVSAERREDAVEWNLPDEAAGRDGTSAGGGTDVAGGDGTSAGSGTDVAGRDGTSAGGGAGAASGDGTPAGSGADAAGGDGTPAGSGAGAAGGDGTSAGGGVDAAGGDRVGSGTDTYGESDAEGGTRADMHLPEDDITDSLAEARLPDNDEQGQTAEPVPFWENRGSGGISFEVIEDDNSKSAGAERNIVDSHKIKYRPIAYLDAEGEVMPLFVCAAGREVRWKYMRGILYVEASTSYAGPYRVCARDSRGNICYFSS